MHLADAFIQSDLQCIQAIHFFISMCVPWELNPQPSTTEPQKYLTLFYNVTLKRPFLKVIVFAILRCSILFWFLENKCDFSPHKSAFACFCCIFCVLSWTFMSLPVSRGVCSQFVSYLVQLVSLLYIYSIYRPSVSLVLCELLNVMVVCGFWFIVCSSFSIKSLHIDPCLCLFSSASPQRCRY